MKARYMMVLAGAVTLGILLAGGQPLGAAPPAGEVKTVAASFGNGVPIPALEAGHANDWMQLLYDTLVDLDPAGKFSPDRGLLTKYEMSRDGLTWTFHIRKGVKFHDGVELTAKDVKFTIEQAVAPGSILDAAPPLRKSLKSMEVKDPYTLLIYLSQPNIFLPNLFNNLGTTAGMVIPKDYYERVGRDEFQKHPIGSGPYKWHSQQAGSFIKLEAIDRHWRDGVPKYKYMTYQIIPEENTQISMLRTDEADIARVSRNGLQEAQSAGLNVLTRGNSQAVTLLCNKQWTSPVFSDIRFRKALNLAIDRQSIIKHIFSGMAKPMAAYPGSYMSVAGGDMTLKPYPYDPKEAARLVKEGGWNGYEFTLISYPRPSCPEYPQVVEAVAGYWEKIGLKPKIQMSEWAVWRLAWREGKTQNTVHGFDDFSGGLGS